MIILLDLNYTLVSNSHDRAAPFARQIEGERYREDLVAALANYRVFLITARPAKYEVATLASIEAKTGWHPERCFFNHLGLPPPETKRRALVGVIAEDYPTEPFLAIESNPRTRAMYARHGVPALVADDWLRAGCPVDEAAPIRLPGLQS